MPAHDQFTFGQFVLRSLITIRFAQSVASCYNGVASAGRAAFHAKQYSDGSDWLFRTVLFLPWPTRRGASGRRRRRSISQVNLRVVVNRCSWSIAIPMDWGSPNVTCASQHTRSWSASPVSTDRSALPVVTDWTSYWRMRAPCQRDG
jgi:hypothetical protein